MNNEKNIRERVKELCIKFGKEKTDLTSLKRSRNMFLCKDGNKVVKVVLPVGGSGNHPIVEIIVEDGDFLAEAYKLKSYILEEVNIGEYETVKVAVL